MFAKAMKWPAPPSITAFALGDLTGDGALDLAGVLANQGDIAVMPGNGDGSLAPATRFSVGPSPADVAIADFDGDRLADVAVALYGTNQIAVLLQLP
jgi:hypothetical protein